ncbi:hypothetical protein ILYODFUR_036077 [Ilyodon furcidens]|uniref:Uncharacterized protein n=1 Tax=Ilyodon furcidens TaxID=33524 RepID=A0ABV0T5S5_9TELE
MGLRVQLLSFEPDVGKLHHAEVGKYKEIYSKEWEAGPELKSSIASAPGDDSKARCKYCNTAIQTQVYYDVQEGLRRRLVFTGVGGFYVAFALKTVSQIWQP